MTGLGQNSNNLHCVVLVVCVGNTSIHAIHIYAYVLYTILIVYTLYIMYAV